MAVQSRASTPSGITTSTLAYTSNNTAGNMLAVYVFGHPALNATTGVSDSAGNVWAKVVGRADVGGDTAELWYALNCAAGANTVTFTWTGLVSFSTCSIAEFSGVATASALDKNTSNDQTNAATTTDAVTTGSVITTTNGQLILGGCGRYSGSGVATTVGTGYALIQDPFGDSPFEEKTQTSAGSVAATFTSDNATNDFVTVMGTFKAISAATVRLLSSTGAGK